MIRLIKNRSLRTIFLAVFAVVVFVSSAIFVFDVDPRLMLQFFIISVAGVGILIFLALCFTGLRVLLKYWSKRA